MEVIVITGVSGAGKSSAARVLEDMGYFCMDNLPPKLLSKAVSLGADSDLKTQRAALVIDIRAGKMFFDLQQELEALREQGALVRILFFDASDEVLISRYHLTRRAHPLMEGHGEIRTIPEALRKEREILSFVREISDIIIDTSVLSPAELKQSIVTLLKLTVHQRITVSVMSFGFAYSPPREADLIFDVRCLPNPFYVSELKALTGKDAAVAEYVFSFEESGEFFCHIYRMLAFALPLYIREGKTRLVVAVGCSGGKHRSVAFCARLAALLSGDGYAVTEDHRDIMR